MKTRLDVRATIDLSDIGPGTTSVSDLRELVEQALNHVGDVKRVDVWVIRDKPLENR